MRFDSPIESIYPARAIQSFEGAIGLFGELTDENAFVSIEHRIANTPVSGRP